MVHGSSALEEHSRRCHPELPPAERCQQADELPSSTAIRPKPDQTLPWHDDPLRALFA